MFLEEYISKEDILEFFKDRETLKIAEDLDNWITKQAHEGNLHNLNCMIRAILIFYGVAGNILVGEKEKPNYDA